jgi:signal transduction histidine kinase
MNLTLNARDAMPKGGTIIFATDFTSIPTRTGQLPPEAIPGDYVSFSIRDHGIGMDESTRARIFEPFFTTKEVNKGSGMGLAMVYGIARQHEGWIDVTTTPGQGSTFSVFFLRRTNYLNPRVNERCRQKAKRRKISRARRSLRWKTTTPSAASSKRSWSFTDTQ